MVSSKGDIASFDVMLFVLAGTSNSVAAFGTYVLNILSL